MTILLTIAVYFGILLAISQAVGRGGNDAFFRGNRQSPWYLVAFGMIGASLSGVTFISVLGMASKTDMTYMQMCIGYIFGYAAVAFILLPIYYRYGLTSIYTYLDKRFGKTSYKTGASFFLLSKFAGAAARLYLVCIILQNYVFDDLHIPYTATVIATLVLIWLYTRKGGIRSLVWTDTLQTLCMIAALVLILVKAMSMLELSPAEAWNTVWNDPHSRMFEFGDWGSKQNFWKQFLSGIFIVIVMTGLDQDMMQRNLSCKNFRDSQKNMITSGISQFFVILLFLMLGVLLYTFTAQQGIKNPDKSDEIFPMIATGNYFPGIVGILFIIGLIASAYSAAGSALTALTTSFTVDILNAQKKGEAALSKIRKHVHIGMAIVMGIIIFVFNLLNNTSVIDAIYTLASYTYGPILGLFAFGIFTKKQIYDKYIPPIAIASPVLCYILQRNSEAWFNGYQISYELLLFNAAFTFTGLCFLIRKKSTINNTTAL